MSDNRFRLPTGGRIRRERPIKFTFNGQVFSGFEGDTLASALLANGERLTARSVVGAVLVIGAVVLLTVSEARRDVGSLTNATPGGAAHN